MSQGKRESNKPKCIAHRKTGAQCGNYPIVGSRVCRVHGGAAPQVRALAHARAAASEVLRIFGMDVDPIDIKDPRETLHSLAVRSHMLLNRLQQSIEEERPEPHKVVAYERALERTANLLVSLENMDQKRKGNTDGPKVVVIDSRMPWERKDDDGDVIDIGEIGP